MLRAAPLIVGVPCPGYIRTRQVPFTRHILPGAAASLPAGNLLIKSTGYTRRGYACKLADFGVSRMLEESQVGDRAGAAGKASE